MATAVVSAVAHVVNPAVCRCEGIFLPLEFGTRNQASGLPENNWTVAVNSISMRLKDTQHATNVQSPRVIIEGEEMTHPRGGGQE